VEQALARVCEMARGGIIPLAALQKLIDYYNLLVQVNRSVGPAYPDWVKELLHPELETVGPAEFNVTELECWLHPDQVEGVVKGNDIYQLLKRENLIKGCLGLADLLAIQKRGIAFFRKYFAEKAVFGWKSVVRDRIGNLNVPYLVVHEGKVIVNWDWLDCSWDSNDPALRFASTQDSES